MYNELLIGHVLVSVCYYLISARNHRQRAGCEAILVGLLPVVGLLLMLAVRLFTRWNHAKEELPIVDWNVQYQPVVRHGQRSDTQIIPIQDALQLEDIHTKRAVLGEVIKRDLLCNNDVLFQAIRDQDTEVAHYAVSTVTHKAAQLEATMYRLAAQVGQNPRDLETLKCYVEAISLYLECSVLDQVSRVKLQQVYARTVEQIILLGDTEPRWLMAKIKSELALQNYDAARKYCEQFLHDYAQQEEPYLLYMELAYALGDYRQLREAVEGLKGLAVQFSPRALAQVRFWEEGEVQHV